MSVLMAIADWWQAPDNELVITGLVFPILAGVILAIILGIWNIIIKARPNSARAQHRDPTDFESPHLLYYPNLKIKTVGYSGELALLKKFLKQKYPFQWCLVTGEGGTGKSKLCYDFMRSVKRKWWKPWGWEPCMPTRTAKAFNMSELKSCIEHLPRKTLFILDYAEYNIKEINEWMSSLPAGKYNKKKIRLILIQRRASESQAPKNYSIDNYRFPKEPISLNRTLSEESIRELRELILELIGKYVKKYKKKVTQSTSEIYDDLVALDKEKHAYVRPLYALMLVDALAENKPISSAKDVMNYIQTREVETIKTSLGTDYPGEKYESTAMILIAIATMTGSISVKETCLDLHNDLPEQDASKSKLFHTISIFNKGYCEPIEPDIIGAYFVLECAEHINEFDDFRKYISYAWQNGTNRYMRGFMTRLMQECDTSSDVFDSTKLDYFSTVEIREGETEIAAQSFKSHIYIKKLTIPASVKKIGIEAFNSCVELEEVVFAENSQLESIGIAAFYGCLKLKSINLPKTLTTIGPRAFEKCPLGDGVIVPASIKSAGMFAFFGCCVTFPDGFDEALKTRMLGGEVIKDFGGLIWDVLGEREYKGRKQKLIITHDVIEKRSFDAVSKDHWFSVDYTGVDWHDCSLRAYLNSAETVCEYPQPDGSTSKIDFQTNGFLSRFTPEELFQICPPEENGVLFTADDNSSEGYVSTNGTSVAPVQGKETIDKVFLLSTKEAKLYFSPTTKSAKQYLEWCHDNGIDIGAPDEEILTGKHSNWFPDEIPMTEDSIVCNGEEAWGWWLRSPGNYSNNAAFVYNAGYVYMNGHYTFRESGGVRPALWLNL